MDKEALLRVRTARLEKLKTRRGKYDAEARKEGHDPRGAPPPNPESTTTPSPRPPHPPKNPPKSRATKKTLAKSHYPFLPTPRSGIKKGGMTSTQN